MLSTTELSIFCVDPHPVVCAGLTHLARDEAGISIAGSATSADEAVARVAAESPDVVLLDPDLLGTDGFALCRRLKSVAPQSRIVLYTAAVSTPGFALQARVAGADGLLDKGAAPERVFTTVRAVGAGATVLPPLDPAELEAAAHRVEPGDLALLAMLADRTSPADVADTLRIDRRGVARRTERMLPRLRGMRPHPA